jgi:hypothetical protein
LLMSSRTLKSSFEVWNQNNMMYFQLIWFYDFTNEFSKTENTWNFNFDSRVKSNGEKQD